MKNAKYKSTTKHVDFGIPDYIDIEHYLQDITKLRDENFNRPRYQFAKMILPSNLKNKRIISIGGGAAEIARLLQDEGATVIFTDGNIRNVQKAENLHFESHLTDLNKGLPQFESEQFDGAEMLDVIEHIPNANFLLGEINRVLKYKGFLLISTPNVASLGLRKKALMGYPPFREGYHFRFFTKRLLEKYLLEKGFIISKRNCIFNRPYRFVIYPILKVLNLEKKSSIVELFEPLFAQDFVYLGIKTKNL